MVFGIIYKTADLLLLLFTEVLKRRRPEAEKPERQNFLLINRHLRQNLSSANRGLTEGKGSLCLGRRECLEENALLWDKNGR